MLGVGITAGLLLVAVTARTWTSPPPAVMPVRLTDCGVVVSSRIGPGSEIGLSVGASLIAVTVTVRVAKLRLKLLLAPPSLTMYRTVRARVDGLSLELE